VAQYTVYDVTLQGCVGLGCDDLSESTVSVFKGSLSSGNYYISPTAGVFRVDGGPRTTSTPPDWASISYTNITGNQDTYCCA
jgi:hypothetical protein